LWSGPPFGPTQSNAPADTVFLVLAAGHWTHTFEGPPRVESLSQVPVVEYTSDADRSASREARPATTLLPPGRVLGAHGSLHQMRRHISQLHVLVLGDPGQELKRLLVGDAVPFDADPKCLPDDAP
jgi:hypothetical protein